MLKDMVSYTDIEGNPATKALFFNLTQFEVEGEMELEILQARFQSFLDEVVGEDGEPIRDMTGPEKREMLGMVKTIIRHAYGLKDGLNFRKSQEIWDDFESSGAFSAYLYQLFLQDGAVNRFMRGIWPQGVDRPTPEGSALSVVPDISEGEKEPNEEAGWDGLDKLSLYSDEYLENCPDDEFEKIFRHFSEGRNVPLPLLIAGGRRKQKEQPE